MNPRLYRGVRTAHDCLVTVNGEPLPPRLELINHSPTGFEWGYAGSGPAQLALAILCDALAHNAELLRIERRLLGYHEPVDPVPGEQQLLPTADDVAVHLHQRFKLEVIASLSRVDDWEMHSMFVRHTLARWGRGS